MAGHTMKRFSEGLVHNVPKGAMWKGAHQPATLKTGGRRKSRRRRRKSRRKSRKRRKTRRRR